jgi:UDP-4-amino-4-deoxy-L-arabinose formyltransferase/UDP-glucuronic acid dehydrogenase (UDP-4-keto-hexauronic acid decarboxylating)
MKAVVFAYHNIGIVGLEALAQEQFDIRAIFSHLDDPGENIWFGSVAEWGKKNQIPVFCPKNVNTPEWIGMIREISPEIIFSFYYRNLLSPDILTIPSAGSFNLHGSLLPAYRGRSPVNWVLVNGEQRTGVTLHHMLKAPDAGDIVGQKEVPIEFADTAYTLYQKLCVRARELLEEVLPLIKEGIAPRVAQDLSQGSYYGGRRPEDGKIDWGWTVMRIYNLIRAVTEPFPGAFTHLPGGEKFLIWWALPEKGSISNGPAGCLEFDKDSVYVRASDGRLRLMDIEVKKERMRGHEILDFFKNQKGVILK